MTYIWINPVTADMYDDKVLREFLKRHGYMEFKTSVDWLDVVKGKYREMVGKSNHTVMDVRCPKVKELIDEYQMELLYNVTVPEIEPILIHCGQEAAKTEEIQNEKKIITTPCQALADMGNRLKLKNTRFLSWRTFLEEIGEEPSGKIPENSPIPPGFFESLKVSGLSLSGEKEIRNYFENYRADEVQLVEMLYCQNGCHNGDGILRCSERNMEHPDDSRMKNRQKAQRERVDYEE